MKHEFESLIMKVEDYQNEISNLKKELSFNDSECQMLRESQDDT
jgi:hypothetical protein